MSICGVLLTLFLFFFLSFFLPSLSCLSSQLDEMCLGLSPDLGDVEDGSLKQTFQAVLDLVGQPQTDHSPSLLSATHLVVSALDG